MLRIGVSGLGSIGCRHARLLAAIGGVEVHGFDPHGTAPAFAADLRGLASTVATFTELLERAPDGVIVATPDAHHVGQATEAIRAGVPVLVEKPLSDSYDDARRLAELAAASSVPATVGYVLRHHGTMRRLHGLLDARAIGSPVSFHATLSAYETLELARNRFDGAAPYQLVFDYSHEWDYLQWLFGPIESCAASGHTIGTLPLVQTPNVVDALLEFAGGVTGTVHLDYVVPGVRRCRVVGDDGVVDVDVAAGTIRVQPRSSTETVESVPEARDVAFARQLDEFLEVATGAALPSVTLADGLRAMAVADALVRACTERRWVEL